MKPPAAITFALLVTPFALHALPVITAGPSPQAMFVCPGSNVTFSITATGNITPLKLQWRLNGTNIPGATNSTLAITNAQDKDHGTYTVLVLDAGGAVGSPRAVLVVDTNEFTQTGGVLNFANFDTGAGGAVDAPVTNGQVSPPLRLSGDGVVAQLWVGPPGTTDPRLLQPTGPLAIFRSGAAAGYFFGGSRFIPIAQPGETITVQVRTFGWRPQPARTFEEGVGFVSQSALIQVQLGTNGNTVPNLVGLNGWHTIFGAWEAQPRSNIVARIGETVELRRQGCPPNPNPPLPEGCSFFGWEKDGAQVPGTYTNLVIGNLQPMDAGEYRVDEQLYSYPLETFRARLSILFNPYFESTSVNGGTFHALIGGTISNSLTVQSSADLINWAPELTVTNLNGFLNFNRDISTNGPHRFFRLLSQ